MSFEVLLAKRRTLLGKYISSAKKEETKKAFSVLLKELDSIKTQGDLNVKISLLESYIQKSTKAHTKQLFSVLLNELYTLNKEMRALETPKKELSPQTAEKPVIKTAVQKTAEAKKQTQAPVPEASAPVKSVVKKPSNVPRPQHPIALHRKVRHKSQSTSWLARLLDDEPVKKEKKSTLAQLSAPVPNPQQQQAAVFFESKTQLDDFFESGFHKKDERSVVQNESLWQKILTFVQDVFSDLFKTKRKVDLSEVRQKYEQEELMRFDGNPLKKADVESFFSINYLKSLARQISAVQKNKTFLDEEESEISLNTLQLENIRRKATSLYGSDVALEGFVEDGKNLSFLTKGGFKSNFKIYEASIVGLYANQFCRKISFTLLKNFPEFFKNLYVALRHANLHILSNTYVNIMVLAVIGSFILFFGLFGLSFFFSFPLFIALSRSFIFSILGACAVFAIMYGYPFMKAQERAKSIKTNLPFAITNMAAVSSAGVPPTKMFKLIMESKEYGEFSVEIQKIVEYMELFGYDLITAIRSVNTVTPSAEMKEFFEGLVNTIESGGDMTQFLEQKAVEALESYELERKKYTETVATYSDIYTGILIAAPLFFVSALSLVSLLGGTVGNIEIKVLVVIGTYLVIPLMNIGFLVFLQISQPEV